jgi:HlyD family secretion protein
MKSKNESSQKSVRNARRWFKRGVAVLVLLVVGGGIVVAALPKPVSVELETVSQGELVVTIDEDGRTRVKDRYTVSAPLTGSLARIELNAGDEVKQGDVLARLVPLQAPLLDARSRSETEERVDASRAGISQVRAQIERARVAFDFAKQEAARLRQLAQSGAVSQLELDRALLDERTSQAELTSAQFAEKVASHELSMAKAALGHYTDQDMESLSVPSPISGRVLKVLQKSEGVVPAGTPLIEVGDPKALEIVVDVLTTDAVSIRSGSPATIEEWGGGPINAAVRLIEPSAFTRLSALGVEEQRVNAIIDLNAPYESWAKLGDGYRVEARIEVFRAEQAIKVPQSSLFRHDGTWACFVVRDGAAELRGVEIGRRNDRHAQVLKGLAAGEQIIVHPSDRVLDGVKVEELGAPQ